MGFFCHSEFTWNLFRILELMKVPLFAILGALNLVYLVELSLQKVQKFIKIKTQSLQMFQNSRFCTSRIPRIVKIHSEFPWKHFYIFRGSEFWFLCIFALFEGIDLPNEQNSEPLKLQKKHFHNFYIFNNWFHVLSKCQKF